MANNGIYILGDSLSVYSGLSGFHSKLQSLVGSDWKVYGKFVGSVNYIYSSLDSYVAMCKGGYFSGGFLDNTGATIYQGVPGSYVILPGLIHNVYATGSLGYYSSVLESNFTKASDWLRGIYTRFKSEGFKVVVGNWVCEGGFNQYQWDRMTCLRNDWFKDEANYTITVGDQVFKEIDAFSDSYAVCVAPKGWAYHIFGNNFFIYGPSAKNYTLLNNGDLLASATSYVFTNPTVNWLDYVGISQNINIDGELLVVTSATNDGNGNWTVHFSRSGAMYHSAGTSVGVYSAIGKLNNNIFLSSDTQYTFKNTTINWASLINRKYRIGSNFTNMSTFDPTNIKDEFITVNAATQLTTPNVFGESDWVVTFLRGQDFNSVRTGPLPSTAKSWPIGQYIHPWSYNWEGGTLASNIDENGDEVQFTIGPGASNIYIYPWQLVSIDNEFFRITSVTGDTVTALRHYTIDTHTSAASSHTAGADVRAINENAYIPVDGDSHMSTAGSYAYAKSVHDSVGTWTTDPPEPISPTWYSLGATEYQITEESPAWYKVNVNTVDIPISIRNGIYMIADSQLIPNYIPNYPVKLLSLLGEPWSMPFINSNGYVLYQTFIGYYERLTRRLPDFDDIIEWLPRLGQWVLGNDVLWQTYHNADGTTWETIKTTVVGPSAGIVILWGLIWDGLSQDTWDESVIRGSPGSQDFCAPPTSAWNVSTRERYKTILQQVFSYFKSLGVAVVYVNTEGGGWYYNQNILDQISHWVRFEAQDVDCYVDCFNAIAETEFAPTQSYFANGVWLYPGYWSPPKNINRQLATEMNRTQLQITVPTSTNPVEQFYPGMHIRIDNELLYVMSVEPGANGDTVTFLSRGYKIAENQSQPAIHLAGTKIYWIGTKKFKYADISPAGPGAVTENPLHLRGEAMELVAQATYDALTDPPEPPDVWYKVGDITANINIIPDGWYSLGSTEYQINQNAPSWYELGVTEYQINQNVPSWYELGNLVEYSINHNPLTWYPIGDMVIHTINESPATWYKLADTVEYKIDQVALSWYKAGNLVNYEIKDSLTPLTWYKTGPQIYFNIPVGYNWYKTGPFIYYNINEGPGRWYEIGPQIYYNLAEQPDQPVNDSIGKWTVGLAAGALLLARLAKGGRR